MTPDRTPSRGERDVDLMHRIRQGDETALATLARLYASWLFTVAVAIVGSPDLAEDVVQDVFVRLWNTRAELPETYESVSGMLYRATRNRAYDLAKHERVQQRLVAGLEAIQGAEPLVANSGEVSIDNAEFRAAFDAALAQLQPRLREIFLMRMEQDMTYDEIAAALGIGVSTVYTQVYRATKKLATQLRMWGKEADGELDLNP